MTIAAGLLCEDGIILASDTMYRTNGGSTYGEKIYPITDRPWLKVAVAGAGPVGFIQAATQKIQNALPLRITPILGVQTIIESANKVFYEQYVLPHSQTPYYGLLIAVSHEINGSILLHTTANATVRVNDRELEGTGGVVAEPYKRLWRKDMPAFEAELMAIFLVKYAKTYDHENCGGETRVFTLYNHRLSQLDAGYISSGERYFKWFDKFSLSMILPADIGELDDEMLESEIGTLVQELKHRRANLIRRHPHAYLPVL
jgi:hypothetical protein